MQTDHIVWTILTNLATQTPVLVVYLVGFIAAVVKYRQGPKPALLVMVALVILVLNILVMTILQAMLPHLLFNPPNRFNDLAFWYVLLGVIRSLIGATALSLLLWAVFSDRLPRRRRSPVDSAPDSPSELPS